MVSAGGDFRYVNGFISYVSGGISVFVRVSRRSVAVQSELRAGGVIAMAASLVSVLVSIAGFGFLGVAGVFVW